MEGKKTALINLLNNNAILPIFRIHCNSLCLEEYLSFWLEVREFLNEAALESSRVNLQNSKAPNSSKKTLSVLARKIFLKYFSIDSAVYIEIDPLIGKELAEGINSDGGNKEIFNRAQLYVYDVLEEKCFKTFIQTEAYKNYIKREKSLYQPREDKLRNIKEIELQFKRIKDAQTHIESIYTSALSKLSANLVACDTVSTLSELFISVGEELSKYEDDETKILVKCLRKVGSVIKEMQEIERSMNKILSESFSAPLSSPISTDLPNAEAAKKKFEKAGGKDITSPVAQETLSILSSTNNKVDHLAFQCLTNLLLEYLRYFEKGCAKTQQALPVLLKLKNQVNQSANNSDGSSNLKPQ